jgi:hypothetical protein
MFIPPRRPTRSRTRSRWHLLLILPVLTPLSLPLANRADPVVLGLPFFYWTQISVIGLGMLTLAIVVLATRR